MRAPRQKRARRSALEERGGDEEDNGSLSEAYVVATRQRQQDAERGRRKRVRSLRGSDNQRDHSGHIVLCEFHLRDERWQRRRVPDARTEQHDTEQNESETLFACTGEHERTDHLYEIRCARRESAISTDLERAGGGGATADCARRCERHRGAGALRTNRRSEKIEQVRHEPDLDEKAGRHRRGEGEESAIVQELTASQRLRIHA